jgi:hypothetical protein
MLAMKGWMDLSSPDTGDIQRVLLPQTGNIKREFLLELFIAYTVLISEKTFQT